MLSLAHRGLLAATTALIAASVLAQPADAATCTRSGYKVVRSDPHTAILERKVKGNGWREGPFRQYACSVQYGRFVALGSWGTTRDGREHSVEQYGINDRYVASSSSWAGSTHGFLNGGEIVVRDLKTRKRLYVASSGESTAFFPSTSVLGQTGDLGWIVDLGGVGDPKEVWIRRLGGGDPVKIATSSEIDPTVLRWSADGTRLVWSTKPTLLTYAERKRRDSDPLHGGRCSRSGDRLLGRGYGYTFFSRAFRSPEWERGRVLIACSLRFKRRVALAHSGEFNGVKYTYEVPRANEYFAASVQRQTDEEGVERTLMMAYDLGREERVCMTEAAPGLDHVEVPMTLLDEDGNVAWTATGKTPKAGLRETQIRVCDSESARTLASGERIDPQLFHFDARNTLAMTTSVQSGP